MMDLHKFQRLGRNLPVILCITSLCLNLLLVALDIIVVVTLFEVLAKKFNSYNSAGWLVTAYSLPNALLCLVWGRVSRVFGRKLTLIVGLVVFEVGSLIVALATSMNMIIAGRVVSGVGGSCINTIVYAIATSVVQPRNRGIVLTALTFGFVIAYGIGPYVFPALTKNVSWRWCFYINLPIGAFALFVFMVTYRADLEVDEHKLTWKRFRSWFARDMFSSAWRYSVFELDLGGFLLCTGGSCLFLVALTYAGLEHGWGSAFVVSFLVVGSVLFVAFILFELFVAHRLRVRPLVPRDFLLKPGILMPNLVMLLIFGAYQIETIYVVRFYQLVKSQDTEAASRHIWNILVPALVVMIFVARVIEKTGILKPMICVCSVTGCIGAGLFVLLDAKTTSGQMIGYAVLSGVSFGIVNQTTLISCQIQLDKTDPDYNQNFTEVTAFSSFCKFLGISVASIMANCVYNNYLVERGQHPNSSSVATNDKAFKGVFYMAVGYCALSVICSLFCSSKRAEPKAKASPQQEPCELAGDKDSNGVSLEDYPVIEEAAIQKDFVTELERRDSKLP